MLTFLWIYLGIGIFYMWLVIEVGNKAAKKKGITFREEVAYQVRDAEPSVAQVFSSMRVLMLVLIIGWFPAIITNVIAAMKKK